MPSSDVLDPAAVADLRRAQDQLGNPAFISQLVGLFHENAPRKMQAIRDAVAGGDGPTLERVAHTLKSNCAFLGASGLAAVCGSLEDAGGRADFGAAAAALTKAEALFPAVLAAVLELGAGD